MKRREETVVGPESDRWILTAYHDILWKCGRLNCCWEYKPSDWSEMEKDIKAQEIANLRELAEMLELNHASL